jgi:Effector-associated domain 10
MSNDRDLDAIFDHIAQRTYPEEDIQTLRQSFAAFKQIIDIKSQNVNFIKRQELFDRLDSWYSSWDTTHQIFTVLGEEGDGKTWGVAYWL